MWHYGAAFLCWTSAICCLLSVTGNSDGLVSLLGFPERGMSASCLTAAADLFRAAGDDGTLQKPAAFLRKFPQICKQQGHDIIWYFCTKNSLATLELSGYCWLYQLGCFWNRCLFCFVSQFQLNPRGVQGNKLINFHFQVVPRTNTFCFD